MAFGTGTHETTQLCLTAIGDNYTDGQSFLDVVTENAGKTWALQPNVTSKVLQSVVFRGGNKVWIAGRGGTMLKRSEPLSPTTFSLPKGPPVLKTSGPRVNPKREPPSSL